MSEQNALQLDTLLDGIQLEDTFSLSRDKSAKADGDTIKLHATWDFSSLTIAEALAKAKSQVRIAFQNANRKNFDNFNDGEHIGVINVVVAGGKVAVDSGKVVANKFAGADLDGKVALLQEITGMNLEDATAAVELQIANQS